jgi:hypothetical protein
MQRRIADVSTIRLFAVEDQRSLTGSLPAVARLKDESRAGQCCERQKDPKALKTDERLHD